MRKESFILVFGTILGTAGLKLKNRASTSFLTLLNKQNNTLEGHIIFKKDMDLIVDHETIEISMNSKVAVTRGIHYVEFSNWTDKAESMEEYQENFDEKVRKKVGIIRNYITYRIRGLEEGALIFFNYENDVDQYDADIVRDIAGHFSCIYSITVKQKENERLQYLVMKKLADLAEKKDHETGEHLLRIQKYCRFIAKMLSVQEKYGGLINNEVIEDIYYSSALHDIGKVGIEDNILLKPGKLTPVEMSVMKTHSLIGAEILEGPAFLKMGCDIAHYHHEKWDGTGYPDGLKDEEIPYSARIMALADVYDALTSKRVYKEAFSHEVAESTIRAGIGSHFDPDVGLVFMENKDQFKEIMGNQKR